MVSVIKPFDGKAATVGNGVMVALVVDARRRSRLFTRRRSRSAGRTKARPGPRGDGFYAGYFRDLDGNKLNAFFLGLASRRSRFARQADALFQALGARSSLTGRCA